MLATENLRKEHQLILKYIALMERYAEFCVNNAQCSMLLEKADSFEALAKPIKANGINSLKVKKRKFTCLK